MRLKTYYLHIVSIFVLAFCLSAGVWAQTDTNAAPGAPGQDAQWSSAGKQAIGTSASLESKIWFTLQGGVLTEVYYPDVTMANVHKLQFVVVNSKTKKVETEFDDATHKIEIVRPDSLSFRQINIAKSGEWQITKTYATHPSGNSVWINVEFQTKSSEFQLYVYYDPSLKNTGMHDTAALFQSNKVATTIETRPGKPNKTVVSEEEGETAFSTTEKDVTSLLLFDTQVKEASSGFFGTSDGLEQLRTSGELKEKYKVAKDGNVVQIARIVNPKRFTVTLAFGKDFGDAFKQLNPKNEDISFEIVRAKYEKGWSDYVKALPKVDAKYQAQFNMAAMVLKAQEDKTVRGANVASLTIPWGGGANANEDIGGGYHLVWSRDLYQVVTAYMALGDMAAANRALDFLFNIQQKPDGSFPQNSWLDGKRGWGSLQLDEVAYPLILAYQLKRFDKATWENHVKLAADFLVKTGPKTPQERWEEKSGYSPSTIAAEIAGLVCAAEIARKNGDEPSATKYLATADDWQANVEKWTATTKGKYGDGNYYLRLTENGKPDAGEKTILNNGAGTFDESEIVDAGFLELVRLGIKSPDDPLIEKSVKVIDEQLKVNTPNGEVFYRYNHDGYGEMGDGRRWNWDGKYTGQGRPWPLLTGERGEYEIALCDKEMSGYWDAGKLIDSLKQKCKQKPQSRLDAMLGFANEGLMIPEQVWDKAETPANIDKQFVPDLKFGEGTGSATPLAWSMAQFIRLAVNLKAGKNLETPDVVYNRYVLGKKSETKNQKSEETQVNSASVDILEIPASFQISNAQYQCLFKMPIFTKDCSYVRTQAEKGSQNPILKECKPSGFFIPCKDNAKEMHACFNYKGEFKSLEIAGDFTGWKPVALSVIKEKSGYLAPCFNFARTARVEYKIIADGKWINDPQNPNKVDNGVGGENSFFTMPDYKSTVWDKDFDNSYIKSEVAELEVESRKFGKRKVKIYVPSLYFKMGVAPKLPVLYLQDGSGYLKRAKAINVLENLTAAKKVKPFMLVFIDPIDRMKEYWANDDWADFIANDVVAAVEKKYFSTIATGRENRALLGASLGGVTSIWTALKHPEMFSRVGGQSSSFWIDDERVVKELAKLDSAKNPFRFYLDVGTLEGAEDDRRVSALLRGKGFPVVYEETETGHNWTAWRDRLADAYVALWNN